MRRLSALRNAETAARAEPAAVTTLDPGVDPPIIATLVEPLLKLRASLGTGVEVPSETIVKALSSASTQAADSEGPHRDGLHALESTWTSDAASTAVPALRTTQTEIGEISDRGPAYLSVLGDAQATSARAARKVDRIIADFRRDARAILSTATSSPDTDAVIDRAAQALREAITTVTQARTEMDDHTRRLDGMDPLTVTTPAGVRNTYNGTGGTAQFTPGATGQPADPVLAAQVQLQQQLINAGVQLGTAAIDAGVSIGTRLIDKIAEVGLKAMDTVAATVNKGLDKAIPELLRPGSTTNNPTGSGATSPSGTSSKPTIDFGTGTQSNPSTGSNPGGQAPFAQNGTSNTAKPPTSQPPSGPFGTNTEAPEPRPSAPAPAAQPGPTGGMMVPPGTQAGEDREHKPRDGQIGVTTPAAAEETVPVAVIGAFDDDTF